MLALLRSEQDRAAAILGSAGVTHAGVRRAVIRMMGTGPDSAEQDEATFTGRAEDALELARREASAAGREQADTEHILLALVTERDGAAVRILLQLDVDPAAIRTAIAR